MEATEENKMEAPVAADIQKVTVADIVNVYMGRDRICRCGCAGTYVTPAENAKLVSRRLSRVKAAQILGEEVEFQPGMNGEAYFNYSYGEDRAITIYVSVPKTEADRRIKWEP
jgi:hypothetical protein